MSNQLPWIIPRYVRPYPEANYTLPLDWVFYNRSARKQPEEVIIKSTDDHKKSNNYLAWVCDEQQQMHSSLKKDGQSQLPSFITISDLYPKNVANGKIQIKKDKISCFSQDAVVFNNGAEVKIDAVVFCTGYRLNLKFLDQTILKELEFSSTDLFQPMILYKSTFHPNLPNMAFVGIYRGTYFAAVELQARWINLVFSGRLPPPSQEELRKGIEGERQVRGQEPRPQFPHPDYVGFADDIARKIGIFPDIKEMEAKQPQLHEKFYKGPVLPSHYRLIGLDAKPDLASQQIAEVNQWIKHRRKESQSNQHLLKTVVRALVGGAGLFVTYQITNRILPAITPSMGR